MTRLVPVTGVLGVVSEVEKRDPDAAQMLAQLGLFEALGDLVDAARPRLDRMVSKAMRARADEGRRAIVRAYVSKRENNGDVGELLEAAYGLTGIEVHIAKAGRGDDPDTPYWDARDEHGRFVRALGTDGMNSEEAIRTAADHIHELKRAGVLDEKAKVRLHGSKTNGDRGYTDTKVGENRRDTADSIREDGPVSHPTHLSVHPKDTNRPTGNRGLAYDAIAGATGNLGLAQRTTRSAPLSGQQFGQELENLTRDSDLSEGDRRAYRQIDATGRALRAVSTPGSVPHVAGGVAQLVGELGPQAEKVLGPGIRRTAYRYRGTERQPDAELVREVSNATPLAGAVASGDTDAIRSVADTQLSARPPGDAATSRPQRSGAGLSVGSAMAVAGRRNRENLSEDQIEMRLRGDTALGYLNRKVATPERTALSIAAGRVPPSQGVIIDRDGDVVTEAMGAGSDHYLPFDLKNLKALQGGQYARTRAAGGPTTEDIYTGLMGGARQIQVVSNSGVFTVEFDENLRGGRRYSDKARQMIGRYEKLLSTVEGGKEYAQDISPVQRREIESAVYRRVGYNEETARPIIDREIDEARLRAQFEQPSDEELEEAAANQVRAEARSGKLSVNSTAQLQRAIQDRTRELVGQQKDERVRRLQLDGEGYARALDALQEEFPYFIRGVDYETRQDFVRNRRMVEPDQPLPSGSPRARDKGYVRPGYRNVTAFDRHGSRSSSPNSTSASGGSGGEGRGGGPGQGSRTATAASDARGQGGKLVSPVGFKPTPANKLSELAGPDQMNRVADALGNSERVLGSYLGADPNDDDIKNPENALSVPGTFVRAMAKKHGNLRSAAKALKDAPPEHIDAFSNGLAEMDRAFDAPGQEAERQDFPADRVKEAQRQLNLLKVGRQPYVDYADDPATYAPENPRAAAPQRFDEIDALGDNAENYEGFRKAARQNAPELEQAIAHLERFQPADRGHQVTEAVRGYKAIQRWAELGSGSPAPQGVPAAVKAKGWSEARNIAEARQNGPEYKALRNLQEAWAYLHGRDAVTALGGGAGPKAAEASAPQSQVPPGPVVFSGQGPQPAKQTFGQSVEWQERNSRRRVVVHPPGSPVAKAFQRARSKRTP